MNSNSYIKVDPDKIAFVVGKDGEIVDHKGIINELLTFKDLNILVVLGHTFETTPVPLLDEIRVCVNNSNLVAQWEPKNGCKLIIRECKEDVIGQLEEFSLYVKDSHKEEYEEHLSRCITHIQYLLEKGNEDALGQISMRYLAKGSVSLKL